MIAHPAPVRQLALDIGRAPSYAADEFLVSPSNARAHAMVEAWPAWPDRLLVVRGPAGSGKSHIGAIWADRAGATIVRPGQPFDPGAWTAPVLALVEDCDRARHEEASLFHLVNLARDMEGWLVLTAREPPDRWGLSTPDLVSRLRRAPMIEIDPPDPTLLRSVIVKQFADRQIRIDDDVVGYAARHCDQTLEAVGAFVAAVDEDSLAAGRRITRPLAVKTLDRLNNEKPATGEVAG